MKISAATVSQLETAVARTHITPGSTEIEKSQASQKTERSQYTPKKIRGIVSWDLSYPSENINWYDEYTARNAPISISWLEQPQDAVHVPAEKREIWGLGFKKNGDNGIVVAPLDDGSICLWDIGINDEAPNKKNGRLLARSESKLFPETGGKSMIARQSEYREKHMACIENHVSIDQHLDKAYIAVQEGLNEVDLATLKVISLQRYPSDISALSEASTPIPLTVGTASSTYLYDPRVSHQALPGSEMTDRLDKAVASPITHDGQPGNLQSDHHSRRTPLSIVHLATSDGLHDAQNGSIYVAGRFPSILIYDRRTFPKVHGTIYSGARLCSLASIVSPPPSHPTIIACGEYVGKGSLELYNISPTSSLSISAWQNRVSASSSKLLHAIPHGTRILFSDSNGMLKWVERDAVTLVRRWNISDMSPWRQSGGVFASCHNHGDVARKLVRTGDGPKDEVLLWTGERVGLVGFRKKARIGSFEEAVAERGEADYLGEGMRKALEMQANEVRFMARLGLGSGGNSRLNG